MDPDIARDTRLRGLDPLAVLLYERLIFAGSDDQGRQSGDLDLIRAACLPLVKVEDDALEAVLAQLAERRMIVRYSVDAEPVVQIGGTPDEWWSMQGSPKRIFPSRWSPPDEWPTDRVQNVRAARSDIPSGQPADNAEQSPTYPIPIRSGSESDPPSPSSAFGDVPEVVVEAVASRLGKVTDGGRRYLLSSWQAVQNVDSMLDAIAVEHGIDANPKTFYSRLHKRSEVLAGLVTDYDGLLEDHKPREGQVPIAEMLKKGREGINPAIFADRRP